MKTTTVPSIRIGPGGSGGRGHIKGLREAARRGLDCMEIEFTYGVRMKPEMAETVGALADDLGITLSVHAPYYINLASYQTDKIDTDPTDNKFLACALEVKADYIVSGDNHLLELKHFHGIQIVDAKAFVEKVAAK